MARQMTGRSKKIDALRLAADVGELEVGPFGNRIAGGYKRRLRGKYFRLPAARFPGSPAEFGFDIS